jgi:hypothetical protein
MMFAFRSIPSLSADRSDAFRGDVWPVVVTTVGGAVKGALVGALAGKLVIGAALGACGGAAFGIVATRWLRRSAAIRGALP